MFDKKAYIKQWRIDNREQTLKQMKQYKYRHKEKIAEYQKEYMEQWRKDNSGYIKEYKKQWHINNKEKILEKVKQWCEDNPEKIKANSKKSSKKYKNNNLEKIKAQSIANRAYPISQICSVAGCNEIGERHHPDYDKPLEIIWLCRKHHKELHEYLKNNNRLRGKI